MSAELMKSKFVHPSVPVADSLYLRDDSFQSSVPCDSHHESYFLEFGSLKFKKEVYKKFKIFNIVA